MALRAAQATPLASDVTLHHGAAALLVTFPRRDRRSAASGQGCGG